MRIRLVIFLLILFISFNIVGCQNTEDQKDMTTDRVDQSDQNTEEILIQGTKNDPREDFITKMGGFEIDTDSDGIAEKIELYTLAERDSNGDMMWDDGQNWLLVVTDEEQYYPLLQQYVQLGEVYFSVWYDDDQKPVINVLVKTSAGVDIANYCYDTDEMAYKEESIYKTGGINFMFSSIPNY